MEYFPLLMDHIVTLFSLRLKDYTQCSFVLYNIVKNCYFVFCGVLFLMSITAFYINLTNMLIMPFFSFYYFCVHLLCYDMNKLLVS